MPMPTIWEMLGGNTLSNTASATADPQTGIMSANPAKVKHPFLSKLTGKDKEIDKLNQALQLLVAQRNSELGGANAAGGRENEQLKLKAKIQQLQALGIPINGNTEAGYAAEAYPKGMFQGAQQVVQSGQGAAIGANQNAQSQAELIGKQVQARIDNFKPQDVIDEDKIAAKKNSLVTIPPNSILGSLNASNGIDPMAYGSLENEVPLYSQFPGMEPQPTGRSYVQRVPGRFIRGNIMGDLQQPNGPALQLGAPAVPVIAPDATAPETKVNPEALGIKPQTSEKKTNYGYQLGYLLKSLGVKPGNSWPFPEQP